MTEFYNLRLNNADMDEYTKQPIQLNRDYYAELIVLKDHELTAQGKLMPSWRHYTEILHTKRKELCEKTYLSLSVVCSSKNMKVWSMCTQHIQIYQSFVFQMNHHLLMSQFIIAVLYL